MLIINIFICSYAKENMAGYSQYCISTTRTESLAESLVKRTYGQAVFGLFKQIPNVVTIVLIA